MAERPRVRRDSPQSMVENWRHRILQEITRHCCSKISLAHYVTAVYEKSLSAETFRFILLLYCLNVV